MHGFEDLFGLGCNSLCAGRQVYRHYCKVLLGMECFLLFLSSGM